MKYCVSHKDKDLLTHCFIWKNKYILKRFYPNKKNYKLHRLIMERKLNRKLNTKEWVDHKDGNGLNNKRSNLRLCTYSESAINRDSFRGKYAKGITVLKNINKKYQVRISKNYKRILIGYFYTLKEAVKAYNQAAKELHGAFFRPSKIKE